MAEPRAIGQADRAKSRGLEVSLIFRRDEVCIKYVCWGTVWNFHQQPQVGFICMYQVSDMARNRTLFISVCKQSYPRVHESLEGRGSRWKLISNYIILYITVYLYIIVYNNIYLLYLIICFSLRHSQNGRFDQNPDITLSKLLLPLWQKAAVPEDIG